MSPVRIRAACLGALLALLQPVATASAVVGGVPDDGALSRSAVMVLNSRGGVCSGVVLAPDAVLTAAHCVGAGDQVRVHFRDEAGAPVLLEPAAVVANGGYDPGAIRGRRRSVDLALLRLREPLPGRFGRATLGSATPAKGASLLLGGFGVSREGDGRSSGTWRVTRLVAAEPHGPSTILLWAAPPAGTTTGACQGDSGGPITGPDGAVAAVSSWAAGAARQTCGSMTQGMLLGPQRPWIDGTLRGWGRAAAWR